MLDPAFMRAANLVAVLAPESNMHNSTLAVLAFGLLAPCLLAQVTNEVEPNDSPAQATAVGCGLHVEGIVNYAGDLDWVLVHDGQRGARAARRRHRA